jgi:hypothetical protein
MDRSNSGAGSRVRSTIDISGSVSESAGGRHSVRLASKEVTASGPRVTRKSLRSLCSFVGVYAIKTLRPSAWRRFAASSAWRSEPCSPRTMTAVMFLGRGARPSVLLESVAIPGSASPALVALKTVSIPSPSIAVSPWARSPITTAPPADAPRVALTGSVSAL